MSMLVISVCDLGIVPMNIFYSLFIDVKIRFPQKSTSPSFALFYSCLLLTRLYSCLTFTILYSCLTLTLSYSCLTLTLLFLSYTYPVILLSYPYPVVFLSYLYHIVFLSYTYPVMFLSYPYPFILLSYPYSLTLFRHELLPYSPIYDIINANRLWSKGRTLTGCCAMLTFHYSILYLT